MPSARFLTPAPCCRDIRLRRCLARLARLSGPHPGIAVEVVDTVGCGDTFMANLLVDIAASASDLISEEGLGWTGRRAVAAGAFEATIAVAMDASPTSAERDAVLLAAHSV
jgi:sugar/nucleoside kinase (ribokinase family)